MKFLLILLCTNFLALNIIEAQKLNSFSNKEMLINQLILNEQIKPAVHNGKLAILKSEFCVSNDCAIFFKDYTEKIGIYSKGDLFQRGISVCIEIEIFDEKKGLIIANISHLTAKEKAKNKRVEIKLD